MHFQLKGTSWCIKWYWQCSKDIAAPFEVDPLDSDFHQWYENQAND